MAYCVELTDLAIDELAAIRVFERRRIVDAIKQQLPFEPQIASRNRKRLEAVVPGFEHVPPLWELRVGDYRVFYDIDEVELLVYVRAVRYKAPNATTEEIVI